MMIALVSFLQLQVVAFTGKWKFLVSQIVFNQMQLTYSISVVLCPNISQAGGQTEWCTFSHQVHAKYLEDAI